MTIVTDAVYVEGVFKPTEALDLCDRQRVRLLVETLESPHESERRAALARFRARTERMNFRSVSPYPTRDELHERR